MRLFKIGETSFFEEIFSTLLNKHTRYEVKHIREIKATLSIILIYYGTFILSKSKQIRPNWKNKLKKQSKII